ncbi:immunoglobulin superfamily member 10 isoform 2-T2 [Pelodytes ibericus]
MKPICRSHPCLLGLLMSLLLIVLPNSCTACPKPCACYVQTEVHCTFRYLTVIPKPIQENVERINLGYNSLNRLTESDFAGLQRMELLMLHSNEIQTIHESTFNDLSSLQVLKMSYNKVKSLHKDTFHGLKNMVRLHIDHNKLEFLHPESFYGLTSLKLIHLEGNMLRQIHTDTFVTLRYIRIFKTSSIKHIYLSGNQLSSLPKEMFLYMTELEGLYLHENPWSCDCDLQWLTEGTQQFRDLIKCKRDRAGQQCPVCAKPRKNFGKSLTDISTDDLSCVKPTIENLVKTKNVTASEEAGFTAIAAKDFVAPIGTLILNMTDHNGNEANLACSVQRPSKMSPITLDIKAEYTVMRTTLSSFLVCSIDYDHIQKLWGILAMYSDSPMKLKRGLLLTKIPNISYKYTQTTSEDEVFTDIKAELQAKPNWLMQDSVTLQLDRTATTLSTLHIQYLADIYLTVPNAVEKPLKGNWVMIVKSNQTKTEYSALIGGTVEMDCEVIGEPTPAIEWVLPDGSKIRAPYLSEEGRITLTKSGKFILKAADRFDTGVYHCIATNYDDADVLSFRITVVSADVERVSVNGAELTVIKGDALYLPCESNGVPDASVSWIFPDKSVLQGTSRDNIIFSNGTLKIQDITKRDQGHFRCLAANQYGFDILIYNILVKGEKVNMLNQNINLGHNQHENDEGSGNEAIEENNSYSATGKAIAHRKFPVRNQSGDRTKLDGKMNSNTGEQGRTKFNKRIRGHRRQFSQTTRRIDPQRWSEILQKTKQNALNNKKGAPVIGRLIKEEQEVESVSGEAEETSGEELIPVEEHFLILPTKHSTATILNAKSTAKTDVDITPLWISTTVQTTVRDMTSVISDISNQYYLDTLTHTTAENIYQEPTTQSLLNSASIDVIVQPTTTSMTMYATSNEVTTSSELAITHSKLQTSDQSTTLFNSLTAKPQSVIINPSTTIGYVHTASQNIITTPTTTVAYMHALSEPETADPTTTVYHGHVTSNSTLNSPVSSSSYLNISSEGTVTSQPPEFSHSNNVPQNDIIHSTSNDFLSSSQGSLTNPTTISSYFQATSQSVPSESHTQSSISTKEYFSSSSSTSYSPFISTNTITKPKVSLEDRNTYTLKVLTTDTLKSLSPMSTVTQKSVTTLPVTVPSTPNDIGRYGSSTIQDEIESLSITTTKETPLVRRENQSTKIPYVKGMKDETEEPIILMIDSSTEASSKLFLSQSEVGPIYIHSTQKIISPQLPAGSTIITHQQIQIVKNVTPLVPTIRRYGRRRISGKRRIIRPDRIPNTRAHKFKFGKSELRDHRHGSTTISEFSKQELLQNNSSDAPTFVSPTTLNVHMSITPDNVYTQESTTPFFTRVDAVSTTSTNNSPSQSATTLLTIPVQKKTTSNYIPSSKSATTSKPIQGISTVNNNITSYQLSTQTISKDISNNLAILGNDHMKVTNRQHTQTQIPPKLPSTKNKQYGSTISPEITTKARAVSRLLRRKIPWHRLFGNNQTIQREIFRKLRKNMQHTSTVTIPMVSSLGPKILTDISILSQTSNTIDITSSTVRPLVTTESTPKQTTIMADTVFTTLSNLQSPEAIPTTNIMLTTPTSFINATISARQKFLRLKRPRKKNSTWKSSLNHMSTNTQSTLNPSILRTSTIKSLEEINKTYSVTQLPLLLGSPITENQATPFSSVVNDILLPTNKRLYWSKSSSTPKTTLQSLTKIKILTEPQPTTYSDPPENNYITTYGHQTNKDTVYTFPATQFKTKTTTSSLDPVMRPKLPGLMTNEVTKNIFDSTTTSTSRTVQSHTFLAKKTTNKGFENRPRLRKPDVIAKNVSMSTKAPNVLKSPRNNNPLPGPTHYEDNKGWLENKGILETTTNRPQNLEPTSHNVQSEPKIMGGNAASFTVLANSDAFIPCEAIGNPTPTILWTKVSSGMFVSKTKRGHKMEVFANGTLSIPNASAHDRGQYLCVATNQYGSDRLLVTLSVITYPPKIQQAKSREITVHSGSSVNIQCQAEGRPFPTITWILANETIASESPMSNKKAFVQPDGTLIIKEVTIYDRGIYKCLATNIAGADTSTVRIQVIAAPPVILEDKRQTVLAIAGENVKLHCTTKGNPQPSVHWVAFDGTKVKPLHYVNAKLFLFSNGTLYIRNVASTDNGNYECIATSSTGSERRVVSLLVQHTNTIPKIVHASPKTTEMSFGDKLMLNCTATGEPQPRIIWRLPSKAVVDQWHRMGSRIQVFPNGSLLVESVNEKDSGDYLCVARNQVGDDLILMKVSVTMKPAKIIQKQQLTKQVPYGKEFKVDCKASGSPLPEITWSLPDGTMINNVLQADDNGRRKRRYILFDNGTLYLNKVGIAEEGDYTCYAENTLGKDEMKVHVSVVTAAPRIQSNHKTQYTARAGEGAVLHCEAIGEPKPKIFWLLPSSDMIATSHDRYVLHDNGSLTINQIKLLDAGEYMCVARNPAGDDTKLLKLDVQSKPPLINGLYTNKTIIKDTALKHSRKLIHCTAEGTPPLQIMWIMPDNIYLTAPYHGSRIMVHKNGTLEIRNVRPTDTAEFTCVARNDGGESMLVVHLEVVDVLRRPMFKNPFNEKLIAKPGKMAILNCFATGNPAPEIIWLLPNGTRFFNGLMPSKYHAGSNGTFIIYSPTKEDTGKYRCAARNKVGYIEKLIILEVGQRPNILTHPRGPIKNIIGETLSLHCLSDGIPRPSVIWTLPSGYVIDRPHVNGRYMLLENGTLVIQETTIYDRGNYLCKAKNNAGEASISVPVMVVAYPPRITNKPPQNIHTRAGSPVHLNCMAIGIPKPEITWELPDLSVLSTASKGRPLGTELLHPQGTLVVQNPKGSDTGIYKCIAKNPLGTDSSSTYLKVV